MRDAELVVVGDFDVAVDTRHADAEGLEQRVLSLGNHSRGSEQHDYQLGQ